MTEKTVINIDDVPLVDRGNGKRFAVKCLMAVAIVVAVLVVILGVTFVDVSSAITS
jgi:hypothetical protein